jgi:predicted HAD superfamily Cof-like phosphohydrolase
MEPFDSICSQVSEFNYLFGVINYQYDPIKTETFIDKFDCANPDFNSKQVKLRYELIREECRELVEAFEQKNKFEIIDALCDILYVVAGAKVYFNLPNEIINKKISGDNIGIVDSSRPINFINQLEIMELILDDDSSNISKKIFKLVDEINFNLGELEVMTKILINPEGPIEFEKIILDYNNYLDIITYNVFSISNIFNFDIEKLFRMVHESNMSKVCTDLDTALRSVEYYKTIEKRYNKPDYKEINYKNKSYWVIFDDETKKILKSIDYSAVNFESLL